MGKNIIGLVSVAVDMFNSLNIDLSALVDIFNYVFSKRVEYFTKHCIFFYTEDAYIFVFVFVCLHLLNLKGKGKVGYNFNYLADEMFHLKHHFALSIPSKLNFFV